MERVADNSGSDPCDEPSFSLSIVFGGVSLTDMRPTLTTQMKVYQEKVSGISEHDFFQHNLTVEKRVSQVNENGNAVGLFAEEDGPDIGGSGLNFDLCN